MIFKSPPFYLVMSLATTCVWALVVIALVNLAASAPGMITDTLQREDQVGRVFSI